jgi:hypothetical protein
MCKMCEVSQNDQFAGGYDFKCLQCCARAIKNARSLGITHQESIFEVISRVRNAPTKEAILGALKK